MNKKSQFDYPIITWVVIAFVLFLVAPIMLKIFNSIQTPFGNALNNMSDKGGIIAHSNFDTVMNTAVTFWDKLVLAGFVLATLLMIISAFMIDTSPVWVILYIFVSFFTILLVPDIIGALDNIYNNASFATETTNLVFINTLRLNFGVILAGIMILTGIIIYGKIALFGNNNQR